MNHLIKTFFISAVLAFGVSVPASADGKNVGTKEYPFVFGAQYYRAPTPAPSEWKADLKRMHELGFTDVKYWVQWRWSNPAPGEYYFDDLDELIKLAAKYDLRVTLNAIMDVAPVWLYEEFPDAKQIQNNGQVVEPYVVAHRQIGGHPGPCYTHPGALKARKDFMRAAVEHFKQFDNVVLWDVWNEPELCFPQRDGKLETLACYCDNCKAGFIEWLKEKYGSLDRLNQVWGRNYREWRQIELPKTGLTITDFVDWREYQASVMLSEAEWRLDTVREIDDRCISYLHVVPNTMQPFNAVTTCMDDFDVAKKCDVFAATMNNGPFFTPQVLSAGKGKVCYNVESHINGGRLSMHQPAIGLNDLLNDFLPQIGMGIKGFMFWQFRPECLGVESPAWGVVNSDGSDRTVTKAVDTFWKTLRPYSAELMDCGRQNPEIAIWKSRKNEIFHYCMDANFNSLANSVNAYATYLYEHNYNYCFVNSEGLDHLEGIKVLIMPSCYYLTEAEVDAVTKFVKKGGILINEAHMGGYNADTGRHSEVMPGFGLDKVFGIKETETISTLRLKLDLKENLDGMNMESDVKKMLKDFGTTGGKFVPVRTSDGNIVWGALRYAKLQTAPGTEVLGSFDGETPTLVSRKVGKGKVYYFGTNLGEGSARDKKGFNRFMTGIFDACPVQHNLSSSVEGIKVETLYGSDDHLEFFVVRNLADQTAETSFEFEGEAHGIFSGKTLKGGSKAAFEGKFCDIFYIK